MILRNDLNSMILGIHSDYFMGGERLLNCVMCYVLVRKR